MKKVKGFFTMAGALLVLFVLLPLMIPFLVFRKSKFPPDDIQ